jgi:hypothetical protein
VLKSFGSSALECWWEVSPEERDGRAIDLVKVDIVCGQACKVHWLTSFCIAIQSLFGNHLISSIHYDMHMNKHYHHVPLVLRCRIADAFTSISVTTGRK